MNARRLDPSSNVFVLFDFGNRNDLVIVYVLFCREPRGGRSALFDGIEEGGIRAASYASHEINEHENERALEGLQDRVFLLKRVSLSHFFSNLHISTACF